MDFPDEIITKSASETHKLGENIGSDIKDHIVFFLYGNLGSGKTTFTQGFARGLGITKRIISPTFILSKQYQIPGSDMTFYHIDLYRVQAKSSQETLGLTELFHDPKTIVIVEWAEFIKNNFPGNRVEMKFRTDKVSHRVISITSYGK